MDELHPRYVRIGAAGAQIRDGVGCVANRGLIAPPRVIVALATVCTPVPMTCKLLRFHRCPSSR
jgi:hypothetical protein